MDKAKLKLLTRILPIALICILGLIAYSNTFNGPFLYDDNQYIITNPAIKHLGDVPSIWKALRHPVRFVTFYTFAINYHFGQLNTFGYHVFNFLIHIFTAILVWWFFNLIFSSPKIKDKEIAQHKYLLAMFGALIFCLHPLQTQAVSYICQRFASLATLFYVASLCLYMKGRMSSSKSVYYYGGAALSAVLGMFTKEIVFTLPIVMVIVEVYFFRKESIKVLLKNKKVWAFLGVMLALFLIIPIVYGGAVWSIIFETKDLLSGSHRGDVITTWNYFLTQSRVVVRYIQLLFLPVGLNLLYDFPLSTTIFDFKTILSFLFIGAVLFAAFKIRKKYSLIAFGIFWYFLCLSVESTFIPIRHVIFEHRNYLPIVGFSLALVVGLSYLIKNRQAYTITLSVIVGLLTILTFQRNIVWTSEEALWSDVAKKSPNDERAYNNLGLAFFNQRDFDTAIEYFNKGISIFPYNAFVHNNRGYCYLEKKQYDLAIRDFTNAIQYKSGFDEAHNNRGLAYKYVGEYDLAMMDYNKALEYNPNYPDAYSNRGIIYERFGKYDLALADYGKALQLNPHFPQAFNNRGNVYRALKEYDKAIADYNRAIEIKPDYFRGYNNRGTIYSDIGDFQRAVNDFKATIQLNPYYVGAYYNLGNVYMQMNQFDLAVVEYSKALQLNPKYSDAYFNRGVTFFRKGQLQRALADYNKVVELNPTNAKVFVQRHNVFMNLKKEDKALEDILKAKALGLPIQQEYIDFVRREAITKE